jgi:pimeloyl-ACP methyl ester carboxylesterase
MKTQSKTVVFITGAFVGNNSWDEWKVYFENKGYTVHVPAWPFKDADPATLRKRHPDAALASLTLAQLIAHFEKFVRALPEKPILIGHSMGGLITQVLLQKNIAAAGIAIHPVPPLGVPPLYYSFLKAGWKPLSLFGSVNKTHMMDFKAWQYAFTNGMTENEQRAAYEQLATPESIRVIRGGLSAAAKVDFKAHHDPLLIIAGDKDNFIPAGLNHDNYKKYKSADSITDYKEFAGRNHFVLGQPTWHEEADYILNWLNK